MEERLQYPISPQYCADWTIKMAIRELIANGLDEVACGTTSPVTIKHYKHTGLSIVSDEGIGLKKRHFVLGISNKGSSEIGQFGEGLKIAGLVFARENRRFKVDTVGFSVEFFVEHSDVFEGELVLVLYFTNSDKKFGTDVTFESSKEELDEARGIFLSLNPRKNNVGKILPDKPGKIYVKGVLIQNMNTLFGYNLASKSMMNRDRTIVDKDTIMAAVNMLLKKNHSPDIANRFFQHLLFGDDKKGFLEFNEYINAINGTWRNSLRRVLSNNRTSMCLPSDNNNGADIQAIKAGYKLAVTGYAGNYTLKKAGMKHANEVIRQKKIRSRRIRVRDMSPKESRNYKQVKRALHLFFGERCGVNVYENLQVDYKNRTVQGRWNGKGMELSRKVLNSPEGALGTSFHEIIHGITGFDDETRTFENALTDIIGRMASNLMDGGKSVNLKKGFTWTNFR